MCTIEYIPQLLEAGIDSFKIEGRMKRPEYAAGVTAVYRKYIDKYYADPKASWKISKADMHALSCLYIRSERQDGYYHKHNGREMVTLNSPAYSGSDDGLLDNIRREHLEHRLSIPVHMQAEFITGKAAVLHLRSGDIRITLEGETVAEAARQPITRENIAKQLGKLGDSHFHLEEAMQIRVSDNAFYPLKAINELRRRGLALLEEQVIQQNGFPYERNSEKGYAQDSQDVFGICPSKEEHKPGVEWAVSLRTPEQWQGFCRSVFYRNRAEGSGRLRLYLDADFLLQDPIQTAKIFRELNEKEILCMVSLPKILRLRDLQYLKSLQELLAENLAYIRGFQAGSLEHIELLRQWNFPGKEIMGDHSLYIWNRNCLDFWKGRINGFCLPLELTSSEQKAVLDPGFPTEKVLYGRIPMMVTANCVVKTTGQCRPKEGSEITELTDRYHKHFPVLRNCIHCFNVIYNSVPLSLHKDREKWQSRVIGRLDFSTETGAETLGVLDYFAGEGSMLPFAEYTTGHEKRGVD